MKTRLTTEDLFSLYTTFDNFVAAGSLHRPDFVMRRKLAKMLLERGASIYGSERVATKDLPSQADLDSYLAAMEPK
jgi:hypothetical protein